ncbi:MAG: TonB-dependent receptor plug domain-containing protein [Chitinophagaceae bacterium]|nr:TonB-dependent receptor plug domain-containing protein [Chitinophagaceae bacterium]
MRTRILTISLFILSTVNGWAQQRWDRPMELKTLSIDIKADGFTATTIIEMEFCNPNNGEIEGLHQFQLKPGQVITAFQLDLHGKYRDGSIEEKWKATNAYNTIVGKRIDPALLTMDYADHYSLRIYPVPANGCRKVTMTIQQLLTVEKNHLVYTLPLNIAELVKQVKLNIAVNSHAIPLTRPGLIAQYYFKNTNNLHTLSWNAADAAIKTPVTFGIPMATSPSLCTKTTGQQTYFALQFQPSSPQEYDIKPKQLAVYWDASASLARRDIGKEISFLKQFISYHNISQLTIIPFNYKLLDTAVFYTENGFNSRWQQYLQDITYDGATQLGVIDMTSIKADMFLVFTDGNNTYGRSKPKTGTSLVSCIHTSNTANLTTLQQVVGAGGGKVIDLNKMNMSVAVATASRADNWLMNITSSSGKVITEQALPLKQETTLFINGSMQAGSDTLIFHYGSNSQIRHTEKMLISSAAACAGSAIDRITMLNNFDRIIRSYSWTNMIDFGLQEKVVTPNTAYIVLERVEDYVKYNITPPKELEAECEKMNYVKRDTRFERRRVEQMGEYDILNNVVNVYNERIRKWDANEKPVYVLKQDMDKPVAGTGTNPGSAARQQTPDNVLAGRVAGVGISNNALEEVVVVGYGAARKRDMTGSVAYIRSQDIFASATSVEQALQGRVPGLQVSSAASVPGASGFISIRGMSSLNNNSQPLYVVDGIPVSGNVNDIVNVHDIDNISVLRDHNASAIFGSRAANGAIVITTKKGKNHYNYYNNKPYRLKDMEDVEYLQELKNSDRPEKIAVYEQLKEQYGGEAGFYFDVAQHLFDIGWKEKAFAVLMNAAEAANGSQQVLLATAYILEQWRQYEEAILIYEQLVKDNPATISYYSDLAWAHYQSGHYQEAVDLLYGAIKMNTGQLEYANIYTKAMMMSEMNAIISLHKDRVDISAIPATLIRALPADLRIVIDCNKGNMSNISIKEPGGYVCNYSNPVTKNGGIIQQGYYYWYNNNPFEYQVKKAPEGKYRISVNYYDYYSYPGKIPSMIRIRKFRNFGKENQSIEVEHMIMDNQYGEIEIAEVKWEEKIFF